ncbi:RnfABCDGE type electron transport complex subunit B [Brucepastera parasyntrophica]|uniref:RnfABCDGE type electron transport complex subunit B n=1 Tax=Brucepastera parasyntrophica TaxID=2880008 RepID=UPI00210B18A4|nr:RnfABCDGE type electron transport complex subunit B [Brucepastera parasyntrophica]ULQ60777.1 RnfABCDGE type electron transport complex subunit B [Brucepastera parasyntrophica]
MHIIIATFIVSAVLALVLGFLLGFFKKIFHVETDPTVEMILNALPGSNCGACGYPGCAACAEAIAGGLAPVTACTSGGADVTKAVCAIMGVEAEADTRVAVLLCQGTTEKTMNKADYIGVKTCRAVKISVNGLKLCDYGCIGMGDCEAVCKFDAIHIGKDGLPHVDYSKCTGCNACVKECPQKILTTVSNVQKGAIALCSNRNPRKAQVIKDCKAGCIKCGKCEKVCPVKAIRIVNGIPLVDYSLCNSCNDCVKQCPTKVLALTETVIQPV